MARKTKIEALSELLVSTANVLSGEELPQSVEPEVSVKTAESEATQSQESTETTSGATPDENYIKIDMAERLAVADLIKTKSIQLNYDVMSDCFLFTKSASMGGMLTDSELDEIDDPAWPEFVGKSLGASSPMEPQDEDMIQINRYTARPHTKEEVRRVFVRAAGTGRDRHGERNRPKALQTGAGMTPGRSLMNNHDMGNVHETWGRLYDAKAMRTKTGGTLLVQKGYLLNSPENQPLIRSLEAGIGSMASVSYKVKRGDYHCSFCNKAMFKDRGQNLEHDATTPPNHPRPEMTFCGHYVGLSKNDRGETCEGIVTDWSDFMETTRTGAPADPDAEFRIKPPTHSFSAPQSMAPPKSMGALIGEYLIKSMGGSLSTLPTDSNKGAQAVVDNQNPQTGAQADKTAADKPAEKPADATAPAGVSNVIQPSEELVKFTKSVDSLQTVVGSFQTAVSAAADVNQKQATALEDFHKALVAEKTARDTNVKEINERFVVLLAMQEENQKQLNDLSKKVDLAASKSIDEMVHKLAAIVPNGVSVASQEAAAKVDDSTGFYHSTIEKMLKGRFGQKS